MIIMSDGREVIAIQWGAREDSRVSVMIVFDRTCLSNEECPVVDGQLGSVWVKKIHSHVDIPSRDNLNTSVISYLQINPFTSFR